MLVLDDSGIRHFTLRIVHHRIALIVRLVDNLGLETDGTIVELAKLIVVELIYLAGEDELVGYLGALVKTCV